MTLGLQAEHKVESISAPVGCAGCGRNATLLEISCRGFINNNRIYTFERTAATVTGLGASVYVQTNKVLLTYLFNVSSNDNNQMNLLG